MTAPTQLRILRASLRTVPSSILTTPCTSYYFLAPPRATARLLHTTSSSRLQTPNKQAEFSTPQPLDLSKPSPTDAMPPATTRPPPLDLPTRQTDQSTFSYLFATGKAYLSFYKTGLRHVYLNTRLVFTLRRAAANPEMLTAPPPPSPDSTVPGPPHPHSRAALLLHHRWRHDIARLPVFALVLLICGEFTPFIVLALPRLVPYTCRIPRQVDKITQQDEARRAASFARSTGRSTDSDNDTGPIDLVAMTTTTTKTLSPVLVRHIAASLHLTSAVWAYLPFGQGAAVTRHVKFLMEDDSRLVRAGGVDALTEDTEVVLACKDRAINTGRIEPEKLRAYLALWLRFTADAAAQGEDKTTETVTALLGRNMAWWDEALSNKAETT